MTNRARRVRRSNSEEEANTIRRLIAEGKELDFNIKEQKRRLDEIKDRIRTFAKRNRQTQIEGDFQTAVFCEHVEKNTIELGDLWTHLGRKWIKIKKLVKVDIAACRRELGEAKFYNLATTTREKFKRVTFGEIDVNGIDEDK